MLALCPNDVSYDYRWVTLGLCCQKYMIQPEIQQGSPQARALSQVGKDVDFWPVSCRISELVQVRIKAASLLLITNRT